MEKALLLVVDVQNVFVNGETKHIIKPINKLIDRWRQISSPIVFGRFINTKDSPWQKIKKTEGARFEPETSLHADLDVQEDDLILKKTKYSMWSDELDQICKKNGVETVYIVGINTDQCVLETAVEVFENNIRPVVIVEACASTRGSEYHQMGLKLLERFIGEEQVIDKL